MPVSAMMLLSVVEYPLQLDCWISQFKTALPCTQFLGILFCTNAPSVITYKTASRGDRPGRGHQAVRYPTPMKRSPRLGAGEAAGTALLAGSSSALSCCDGLDSTRPAPVDIYVLLLLLLHACCCVYLWCYHASLSVVS